MNRYYLLSMLMLTILLGFHPLFTMDSQPNNTNTASNYAHYLIPATCLVSGAVLGTLSAYWNTAQLAPNYGLIAGIHQVLPGNITLAAKNLADNLPLSTLPQWVLVNSEKLQQKAFLLAAGSIASFLAASIKSKKDPHNKTLTMQLKNAAFSLLTFYLAYKSALYFELPTSAIKNLHYSELLANLSTLSTPLNITTRAIDNSLSPSPILGEYTPALSPAQEHSGIFRSLLTQIATKGKVLQEKTNKAIDAFDQRFAGSTNAPEPAVPDDFS